jgi:PP-loop superfamily ATP-utilizing enzyme
LAAVATTTKLKEQVLRLVLEAERFDRQLEGIKEVHVASSQWLAVIEREG